MKQKMSQKKQSVAKNVVTILEADPYAKQAMRLGIANFSAIAELIKREHLPSASIASIKAAIRRYAPSVKQYEYYRDLRGILRGTTCSLKGSVAVLTLFQGTRLNTVQISEKAGSDFSLVSSHSGATLIIDEEHLASVKKAIGSGNIRSISRKLSTVVLTSPPDIKETQGFVAYTSELLARNGINIVEFYSCYRDTVFVLEKKDAVKAYELLEANITGEI